MKKSDYNNWVEWSGGDNPIKEGQHFVYEVRATRLTPVLAELFGEISPVGDYDNADEMWWDHHKEGEFKYGGDVVAYAIVEDN